MLDNDSAATTEKRSWNRKRIRRVLAGSLVLMTALVCQAATGQNQRKPEIWFFMRGSESSVNGVDWKQGWARLANASSPTPRVLDNVQVVAISPNVPDDLLAKALATLKKKGVRLGMEFLAQSWVDQPSCGQKIEGYTDPPGNAKIAERIKAAGGTLTYLTMDEPLYYGHYFNAPSACHSSINNVADRVAAIIREYRRVFPGVAVGDTEPFPALTKQADWQEAYRAWLTAFKRATGQSIAFTNMDINWPEDHGDWTGSVRKAARFFRSEGIPFGIIFNASIPGETSERRWLDSALGNFSRIEQELDIHPSKVLFESWDRFPARTFTSIDGPGEDCLVMRYLHLQPP
jgi:hypothetical protein